MSDKVARRAQREQAVKGFNALALEFEEDTLKVRAAGDEVTELFGRLGDIMPHERRGELEQLRQQWEDNGGLGSFPAFADEASPQSGPVPSHDRCSGRQGVQVTQQSVHVDVQQSPLPGNRRLLEHFSEMGRD